jgi:hypothetical protein
MTGMLHVHDILDFKDYTCAIKRVLPHALQINIVFIDTFILNLNNVTNKVLCFVSAIG